MGQMTRAIYLGEKPFAGLVPPVLDQVFAALSPEIGQPAARLREAYFTSIHGFFALSQEEMDRVIMQLSPLQREVMRHLRAGNRGLDWRNTYMPGGDELETALDAACAGIAGVDLIERVLTEDLAFFRIGRGGGGPVEVTFSTKLGQTGAYTSDSFVNAGVRTKLSCNLRRLFGDLSDPVYYAPEDVTRCTGDIVLYAAAVFDWWDG
jgi:hypothetical protein